MTNNTFQVRLQRSRRYRSWANSNPNNSCSGDVSSVGGGDSGSVNSVGSISPENGNGQSEERSKCQNTLESPRSMASLVIDNSSKERNKNDKITTTVSSRRQRMMDLSTKTSLKNQAQRVAYKNPSTSAIAPLYHSQTTFRPYNTENKNIINSTDSIGKVLATVKPHSLQSCSSKLISEYVHPESIDTQHNDYADVISSDDSNHSIQQQQQKINRITNWSPKTHPSPLASSPCESAIYQASAMEDSDGSDEHIYSEGPPFSHNKISHNRIFQRDEGYVTSPSSTTFDNNKHLQSRHHHHERKDEGGERDGHYSDQEIPSNASSPALLTKIHSRGSRAVVSRSPTTSIDSIDTQFSAQQQFHNIPNSNNNDNKKGWKNATLMKVNKVSGSPEVQRSISSASYGSQKSNHYQPRDSNRSNESIPSQGCMYKNLLKPIQKEILVNKNCHEKKAFGAIIETPQKSSVSSLHAMFDSQKTAPLLMPMNSTDSRVRHSLPLPAKGNDQKPARLTIATQHRDAGSVATSSVRTGGVASRYRSVKGRSNMQLAPKEDPDTSSQTVDKSNEHNNKYEQTQQTSSKIQQYYKTSVRVQNNTLVEVEQISEEDSTMNSRNEESIVSSIYYEPRSPQKIVLSYGGQKYKEEKQLEQMQQHNHKEEIPTTVVKEESTPFEENSRLREYYKSSLRIDNADEEVKSMDETFVDNKAKNIHTEKETNHITLCSQISQDSYKSSVVSFCEESCKTQIIINDGPESTNISRNFEATEIHDISGNFEATEIQDITSKLYEPKEMSPSAVSIYWQNKKSKEGKNRVLNPTANSISDENDNEQNKPEDEELKYSKSFSISNQIKDNHDMNHDVVRESVSLPTESAKDIVPRVTSFIDASVPQESQESKESQESNENSQLSASDKPWEKDTMHSVVQSWQTRSSTKRKDFNLGGNNDSSSFTKSTTGTNNEQVKTLDIAQSSEWTSSNKEIESLALSNSQYLSSREDKASTIDEGVIVDHKKIPELMTNSYSDYFIEEKKSGDLSIDEDKILGEDAHECSSPKQDGVLSTKEDETSNHSQKKVLYYDDDSYISRSDTDSREFGTSDSFKTTSARSRTGATWNSEDISVYVEDERIITKKEDKILIAQFKQMNIEVDEEVTRRKEEIDTPTVVNSSAPAGKNLPRLNPSPKDNDRYRIGYFGDGAPVTTRGFQRRNHGNVHSTNSVPDPDVQLVQTNTSKNQVFDVWASTTASNEERDEAIKFDQTHQWLDRDPDVDNSLGDGASVSSDLNNNYTSKTSVTDQAEIHAEPVDFRNSSAIWSPPAEKGPKQSFRNTEKQPSKPHTKQTNAQNVFDPFGIDAEDGPESEVSEELFSPNQDLFMKEESFSPLEWSTTPRRSSNSTPNAQHIGYYNSPDSRVEI